MSSTVEFVALFLGAFGVLLPTTVSLATQELKSLIVGGVEPPEKLFPFYASLRDQRNQHFCGGSILNNRFVLTSAHCIVDRFIKSFNVVVGTNGHFLGGDKYSVVKTIIHEDFDILTMNNDIGLVQVDQDMKRSALVQPIALSDEDIGPGVDMFASAWEGPLSNTLLGQQRFIKVTSLSDGECQSRYKNIRPVYSSQICTITKAGEGSCHGDSGGPLVKNGKQLGVVSWGMLPCDNLSNPSVYTRVSSYRDWIQRNSNDNPTPFMN